MDNTTDPKSKVASQPLGAYQKGVDKALSQAGEAHVVEAVQSGVPIQDILAQLQQLSKTQVPAKPTEGGGMLSGRQGLVPAIINGLQGGNFNPMAQNTQDLGFDNAAKLMTLQQTIGKNQIDAQKAPLETKKLEQDIAAGDPQAKIDQAKNEAQAKGSFLSANDLFTKFESSVQPFVVQRDAYSRIKEAGKEPSAAGDLALIYGYMKILDPGSTVREGEFATAQNSGSVPERIKAMYNKVTSGKRLTPEQRTDFLDRSKRVYGSAESQYSKTRKEFTKLAIANKLDPEALIRDLSIQDTPEQPQASKSLPSASQAPKGATGWDTDKGEWVY